MALPSKRPTILICDDEEGVRESFKLVLSDDYDLRLVTNGVEALELLKTFSPDAMLLDIKMPKLHGMEILKTIKKRKPKLPVIIVTGYQSVEMAQEAIRNGASDYIAKPFDSKHLLKSIAHVLK
ncbi:MAG: response regulator [Candidatus Omnitrophica bacterium]|nr:response regulator [Candidatus Omnitrophota bacterium]